MKALGKILIGVPVIALGTYAVVGFWGVPYLVQRALENAVKETNPKATVSVQSFSFNPFTLPPTFAASRFAMPWFRGPKPTQPSNA